MMKLATTVLVALCAVANGEFNECLGVEVAHLPTIKRCTQLYEACEVGVSKLNDQLYQPMGNLFHPVSLISATKSESKVTNHTTIALLVQLAPSAHCESIKDKTSTHVSSEKCTFDMGKVEVYSLLLKQDKAPKWNLDGYKHHALSAEERNQIVAEYKTGKFYGSNLAIGIFDSSSVPAGSVSDSSSKTFTRSPLVVFALLASATVSIGLLFHQRRRLHNGYAPISKRGQVQGKQHDTNQHYTDPLRVHKTGEEVSFKQETNERFAV